MIVVSDTGPINYLTLVGHVDALHSLYGQVVIPRAVADELLCAASPAHVRALVHSPPPWLRIDAAPPHDPELSSLGDGEQQAIVLAKALGADLLLCDDRDARAAAQRNNIRVVGTLGVLREAARRGILDLAAAISTLRGTNFRASKALLDRIFEDTRGDE